MVHLKIIKKERYSYDIVDEYGIIVGDVFRVSPLEYYVHIYLLGDIKKPFKSLCEIKRYFNKLSKVADNFN